MNIDFSENRPTSAIIIPTFNREEVLLSTIEQVLNLKPLPNEILVIDQTINHSSQTDRQLQVWLEAGKIKWIKQEKANLPLARNRGLQETQCEIVIFIDDDVVLPTHFLDAHLTNYANPLVSAVAGSVLLNDKMRIGKCAEHNDPILFAYYFPINFDKRVENLWRVPGCNHSVRRSVALAVGGYDEAFIGSAQGEDRDFGYRLGKAGHRIVYDPNANLVHLVAGSGGCRTPGNVAVAEFEKLASFGLLWSKYFRRHTPRGFLKLVLRTGPFRKENVINPVRHIVSWIALFRAIRYGLSHTTKC